ncbi:unnamed protein product, partial [Durusdinium trenchii]
MAPARKKARGGGSVGVGPTDVTPTSVAQVGAFQKDVALCVELMYSLRHGGGPQGKRSFDDMTGEGGEYEFPLCKGGTFIDIAQRAQSTTWIQEESAKMLHAAGFLDSEGPHELISKYVISYAKSIALTRFKEAGLTQNAQGSDCKMLGQVQPVSSFAWSAILKTVACDDASVSFEEEAYARVVSVAKMDLMMSKLSKFKSAVAADSGLSLEDVAVLGWGDLNKGAKRLEMLLEPALRHCKVQCVIICNLTGYVEELAVAVMNLRLKKSFGEGSHLNPEKLYYPSVHSLDGVEGFKYARDRVYRDLLDLWLEKKISYAGITFSETDEVLSEEEREKKDIEGLKYLDAPEGMDLQVLAEVKILESLESLKGAEEILVRYVPVEPGASAEEEGKYPGLDWEDGDKTTIQVDTSSLQPESTAQETMTIYKYLLMLERTKKVTEYSLSYSVRTRRATSGADGFDIAAKNKHTYKTLPDLSKPLTCKSVFHDCAPRVKASKACLTVFRFRYDRVHAVAKVQKPYIFSKVALTLEPGKPV